MRGGFPYRFNYNDPLLQKRRRAAKIKLLAGFGVLFGLSAISAYVFFFSGLFEIRDIALDGLITIDQGLVLARMGEVMEKKLAGFIPLRKNVFYFNAGLIEDDFLKTWPQLADISVSRDLFHGIKVSFTERKLAGIWCAGTEGKCTYFDESGYMWGNAPRSSGSLVIVVEDGRRDSPAFDNEYFEPISTASSRLKQLGLGVKRAQIDKEDFRDFSIYTFGGFPVMLSLDTDVNSQMDVLRLFLNQKAPKNWNPEYIDLRIDGRIYYK